MTYRECDICGHRNDPEKDTMNQVAVYTDKHAHASPFIVKDVCYSCMPEIKGRLTEALKRKEK